MSKIYLQEFKKRITELSSSEQEANFVYRALLSDFCDVPFSEVIFVQDKNVSEDQKEQIEKAIERLQKNEPLQHVLGKTEFCELNIICSKHALIPRPETEELVHWILEDFKQDKVLTFLDLCTGTGCIALALKSKFLKSNVEGVDYSMDALNLAELNRKQLNIEIDFYQANLLDEWSPKSLEFDIWVSNPPYIPQIEIAEMDKRVIDFEPEMALFVPNKTPFIFYERIAEKGQIFLKNNGHLYVEIHENFADEVKAIFRKFGYRNLEIRQDLQGKNRMIKAVK
jgi:release factor glutamine methyltransferase